MAAEFLFRDSALILVVIWNAVLSPNDWVSFQPTMIGLDENQFLGHELCQLRRFRSFSNFNINPTMTVCANYYGSSHLKPLFARL